jgi:hypothetical protein
MPKLLLPRRYTEDSILLWKAAIESGWETERLFSYDMPAHLRESKDLVFYGETVMADAATQQLNFALIEPPDNWLPSLPSSYRLRSVELTTYVEACVESGPLFFKPANDKMFPAGVRASGKELLYFNVEPTSPVLVSEAVDFRVEYRCFVLDQEIETLAPYNGEEEPEDRSHARAFLQDFLRDPYVQLPPAVVVDVGYIRGRGWAVVEANPCWASGIYTCHPHSVLKVLQRASVWDRSIVDERWLRYRVLL